MNKIFMSIAIVYCTVVFGGKGYEVTYSKPADGEINSGTEIGVYYFNGEAGDKVSIRLAPYGGGFPDSRVQLIAPNDTILKTQEAYNGNLNTIEDCILPAGGIYTIRISEIQGDQTFKYTLRLYSRLYTLSHADTIHFDKAVYDSLAPRVDGDCYLFKGIAGDTISIRLAPDSSGFPVSRLQLIAPNDIILKTQEAYNDNLNVIEDFILPTSGIYMIRIFEIQGDQTFKYTLGLYSRQQGVPQEDTLQVMKPVSNNRQFADNNTVQGNQRQLLSTDTTGNSMQDLSGIISTGKALGATGILLWGTGKAFEIIGLSVMFSGAVEGHISNENFFTGFTLVMSGAVLDLFGAIPACIGESIVMRSIKKSNISLNDQDFKLYSKGGALYGASWSLLGLGVCMNILAATTNTLPLVFIGIAASGTAEVLRGVAAIVPLVRVGKAQKLLNVRVTPTMDWKGNVGLGLAGTF